MNTTEITARAKAYSSEGIKTHKFSIDADGTVRVWDSVAGQWDCVACLSVACLGLSGRKLPKRLQGVIRNL